MHQVCIDRLQIRCLQLKGTNQVLIAHGVAYGLRDTVYLQPIETLRIK